MKITEYKPRDYFLPYHNRDKRWSVIIAHRRAGKTVAVAADLVIAALECPHPRPQVAYVAPYRDQAKRVIWTYLKELTADIQTKKPNETELRITIHNARGDESTIFVGGADNADAYRGQYFDAIAIDEVGDVKGSVWYSVLRPALSDRRGHATFIGTPKGKNLFWNLREEARLNPNTHLLLELPVTKTNVLHPGEVADAKAQMTRDAFDIEYMCSFEASIPGAFYAREIALAREEGRIGNFQRDPELPVHVVGDLGFTDSCSWWVFQLSPDGVRVVDFHEADGQPISYYINWIHGLSGKVQDVWLPHDARAKSLQTGKSMIEQFLEAGITPRLVPQLSVLDGIEAGRQTLAYTYFNEETTRDGLDHLVGYSREYDEKTQTFRSRPKHDQHSHAADAFRYLALAAPKRISRRVDDTPTVGLKPQQAQGAHYAFSLDDIWDTGPVTSTRIG